MLGNLTGSDHVAAKWILLEHMFSIHNEIII
jgi:hypothetical protein